MSIIKQLLLAAVTVVSTATMGQGSIAEREYWLDGDATSRKPLTESVATVDISSLINGLHSITMRVKDDTGLWSTPMTQYFIIAAGEQTTGKDIVERKTKKGRRYYGCEGAPDCDFMSWQRPTKEKCPNCNNVMVVKGNRLVCATEGCGYSIDRPEESR